MPIGSFWTGALCSNAAWISIWPMDVIKTQIQSGRFKDKSIPQLAVHLFRTGQLYRGLLPGVARSGIANGISMIIYDKTMDTLKNYR